MSLRFQPLMLDFLVVQWLRPRTSTAGAWVRSLDMSDMDKLFLFFKRERSLLHRLLSHKPGPQQIQPGLLQRFHPDLPDSPHTSKSTFQRELQATPLGGFPCLLSKRPGSQQRLWAHVGPPAAPFPLWHLPSLCFHRGDLASSVNTPCSPTWTWNILLSWSIYWSSRF